MKKVMLLTVTLAACASGLPTVQVGSPGAGANKPHVTTAQFPGRVSVVEFPSTRRIAPRLLSIGELTAAVDLCVRPSGETAGVRLRQSSGDSAFDHAILDDVRAWRYEPGSALACEQAKINFTP